MIDGLGQRIEHGWASVVALVVCCTLKIGLLGAILFGGGSIAGLGLGTGMTPVVLLGGVVMLAGLTCLGLHRRFHSRESDDRLSTDQTAAEDASVEGQHSG